VPVQGEVVRADLAAVKVAAGMVAAGMVAAGMVAAGMVAVAMVAGLAAAAEEEDETAVGLEEVEDLAAGAVLAVGLDLAVLAVGWDLAVLAAGDLAVAVLEAVALEEEGAAEEALVEVVEVVRLLYGKHFR
jgi:hypothetical protein